MRELERRIATLRLRLAEISAREEQVKAVQRQYRSQLERLMDFAIYDRGDLGSALSMAEEVHSRLAEADRTLGYLETIKSRGKEELDALLLTSSIESAKVDMAELETQLHRLDDEMGRLETPPDATEPGEGDDQTKLVQLRAQHDRLDAEIKRLRTAISKASDEAARAVAERTRRHQNRAAEQNP